MSLVVSFFEKHLITMLESVVEAHEPELQADLLAELKMASEKATAWIDAKILHKDPIASATV
jgi:hypothetical protein